MRSLPKPLRNLVVLALAVAALPASALTLTFDAPIRTARVGETVSFTGRLFNDGATDLFIAGSTLALDTYEPQDWRGLTVEDTFLTNFLMDYPDLLPAGATWSGEFFNVAVGPTAAFQTNFGNLSMSNAAGRVIADQNFGLSVQAVPEPASCAALLGGLALLRRRR